MKYSIIIPVYNAEKTIKRCLNSILSCQYNDYEILLVNDGSSDNSLELCNDFADKHENIVVIDKQNGGVSSARNAGLDKASGRYILFVDSDDYVSENYFSVIDDKSIDNGLAVFTYTWLKSDGFEKRNISTDNNLPFFEKVYSLVLNRSINSPYAKIFDKRIIDEIQLRFDERMPVAEDFIFCLRYALACDRVEVYNDSIYVYDLRSEDSLVHKRKTGLIDIYPIVFDSAFDAITNSDFTDNEKQRLYIVCDKLHTDSFGTCVMEELKDKEKSAMETIGYIRKMCDKFYSRYNKIYGYQNIVHRVMRFCIKHKLAVVLYVLGKKYMKMRG